MTEDTIEHPEAMTFSGLILGFSSAALYYLGHTPVDGDEVGKVNLPLSRQNIDIIELLKQKTTGNLSEDEEELVSTVLLDLKGKYAAASKE